MKVPNKAKFVIVAERAEMLKTEDVWEEGAVGGPNDGVVWYESNFGVFDDLQSLVNEIGSRIDSPMDLNHWESMFDGRIDTQFTVDENNIPATDRQIERWQKGKERLWIADVMVYVRFAKTWTPEEDELNDMLSGRKANPFKSKDSKRGGLKNKLMR